MARPRLRDEWTEAELVALAEYRFGGLELKPRLADVMAYLNAVVLKEDRAARAARGWSTEASHV